MVTSPRSRTERDDGHLLIGGPGRSGTTLLVQWFTALGFDTGFTLEQALRRVNDVSHAGLEHSLQRRPLPYVAKSPYFGNNPAPLLSSGELHVRAVVVPLRPLHAAAASRRDASRRAAEQGLDPLAQPGGLSFGARKDPEVQEEGIGVAFYRLVQTLVAFEIPIYFLRFPEFAKGEQDLFLALRPLLEEHGVTAAEAREALDTVARPELIHDF